MERPEEVLNVIIPCGIEGDEEEAQQRRTFLETIDPVIVSGDKDNMLEGFRRQRGGTRQRKGARPGAAI